MNKKIIEYRKNFPILDEIIYLDSAALVLKPISVVESMNNYYLNIAISPKTSDTPLSIKIKKEYNELKNEISSLVNCKNDEIILTSGTTESINYFTLMAEDIINKDDEIILSEMNHSSNTVSWIELAKKKKAKIIITNDIISKISPKTKIIAMSQKSNSFDDNNNFDEISKITREKNIILFNDAAQAIFDKKVDLSYSEVIAFSSNKIYGPNGMGALIIRKKLLNELKPKKYGTGSLDYVNAENNLEWKAKDSNASHEPGTPNIAGYFGFNSSLKYFKEIIKEEKHLKEISNYAFEKISSIKNIKIHTKKGNNIIVFDIENISSQDVATYLGNRNIYIRNGYFCNLINPKNKTKGGFLRVSLAHYNIKEDIDKLVETIEQGGDFLEFI